MPRKKIDLPVRPVDFPCPNCGYTVTLTTTVKLYCSDLCSDEAHFVRYFRARISDGRINQPDIKEALQIRMGHILAGGYNERERRLPDDVRRAVFERDKNLCRKCGQPGTDIDHIEGSSNALENLQVLCKPCHNEKTLLRFRPLPPEDEEEGGEVRAKKERLLLRVHSLTPQRACDDEEGWNALSRRLMSERRQALREERLRYKKMSKAEETKVDVDSLTEELNELGKLREQQEALKEEQEARIAEFYTPELKARVEDIKAEFADCAASTKEQIDILSARVKERVAKYGETVNGSDWQAVWRKGHADWDTDSINSYAKTHPEILIFRTLWDLEAIEDYAESNPEIRDLCCTAGEPGVSIRRIQRRSNKKSDSD